MDSLHFLVYFYQNHHRFDYFLIIRSKASVQSLNQSLGAIILYFLLQNITLKRDFCLKVILYFWMIVNLSPCIPLSSFGFPYKQILRQIFNFPTNLTEFQNNYSKEYLQECKNTQYLTRKISQYLGSPLNITKKVEKQDPYEMK